MKYLNYTYKPTKCLLGYWDGTSLGQERDVAFWTLPKHALTTSIHYFADLNSDPTTYGETVRVFGFGGTGSQLNYATYEVSDENHIANPDEGYLIEGKFLGLGDTVGGDSGGPYLNKQNQIIGIHSLSRESTKPGYGYGYNLHYAKDFILNTINGWHYPTVVKTNNGLATIKIQSLHALGNETDPQNTMTVSGDVSVLGGSCQTAGVLNAFATCTYEIESQGGEGTLTLSNTEVITINPQETQPEDNNAGSSSSSSGGGGSLGWMTGLALLGLTIRRRKVATQ
ncbi:trypsin [Vibrio mediterranei]|uniref:Trypsin n=1 Tax=Vibrio mediterranei TaxID=689 RepID=A0ABX5D427_9VIBR|nr:trypsin [Vibrio mediterranei]PRQ64422.1 trypsin [Vibrio mediterranei]PRQ64482.1 trypsin [Vibrio mediterranei]